MTTHTDLFEARTALESAAGIITYYRLEALTKWGVQGLDRLPFTIKILLDVRSLFVKLNEEKTKNTPWMLSRQKDMESVSSE